MRCESTHSHCRTCETHGPAPFRSDTTGLARESSDRTRSSEASRQPPTRRPRDVRRAPRWAGVKSSPRPAERTGGSQFAVFTGSYSSDFPGRWGDAGPSARTLTSSHHVRRRGAWRSPLRVSQASWMRAACPAPGLGAIAPPPHTGPEPGESSYRSSSDARRSSCSASRRRPAIR